MHAMKGQTTNFFALSSGLLVFWMLWCGKDYKIAISEQRNNRQVFACAVKNSCVVGNLNLSFKISFRWRGVVVLLFKGTLSWLKNVVPAFLHNFKVICRFSRWAFSWYTVKTCLRHGHIGITCPCFVFLWTRPWVVPTAYTCYFDSKSYNLVFKYSISLPILFPVSIPVFSRSLRYSAAVFLLAIPASTRNCPLV